MNFNQTILELKLVGSKCPAICNYILIRPFWNWNSCLYFAFTCSDTILIRPFWNWNLDVVKTAIIEATLILIRPFWNWNHTACGWHKNRKFDFNQTILELKLLDSWDEHKSWQDFNQTILELKLLYQFIKIWRFTILIRPFWNWNEWWTG